MAKQSVFYFIAPAVEDKESALYRMAATTDIRISRSARATRSRVESGKSLTDNYHLDNWDISFDGVITNVGIYKEGNTFLETSDWISQVNNLREETPIRPLTVVADNIVIENCIITNFTASKSKAEGLGGWRVSLSFQDITFVSKASLVLVQSPSEETKDDVADKTTGNNQTTKGMTEIDKNAVITSQIAVGNAAVSSVDLVTPSEG
ncbi:hypothetical protein [Pseudoalteromonas phage J2-1]|uniref:Dit-like phage tail protein N-terminal domain-containing protein n=1 Tax=Pseudoalteromonas phage J2-1 TaxID=2023998 RepID=A0A223LIL8_9CAUD|nr:endolysin [Pseudoalteromonas phage J2-1]ASU03366.1 hypothetical protein [Pseudoalteromonas phage J2-1]